MSADDFGCECARTSDDYLYRAGKVLTRRDLDDMFQRIEEFRSSQTIGEKIIKYANRIKNYLRN
ncbi:MAG: hypothetical protein AABW79_04735 [Nanoarchaeota archaeon]